MIGIADAPDTTITVDLGDGAHSVTAYALGFETAPGQHPYPMGLVNIDRRLQELATEVASVGDAYAAERARVTAFADEFSEPGPAWPQDVVPVPDGAAAATPQSPATVDVEGADEVAALGGAFGEFRQATWTLDGANLTVVWRPLLPHE